MRLHDVKLEMSSLRTMTDSTNKMASAGLLASVTKEHFYDEVAVEVFERLAAVVARESRIPKWSELSVDPLLSEETREELESYEDVKPVRREARIHRLYSNLDYYRKARTIFFQSESNLKALDKDKVDVDSLITSNVEGLLKAQINPRKQDQVVSIGTKNDNSKPIFERLISGERAAVVRTGFKTFDERNGGIMLGSLWVIAATTGGGKSAMVSQLMKNMAGGGEKVCGVPLEMSDQEMLARIVSNTAQIDLKKYLFTQLTKREKKVTIERWKKYTDEINRLGGALRIFEPEEDMAIEEILTLLRPYNDRVIIIDYISLLKGVDGDDSWRQLGKAARYAKIWAKNNNRIVVLLAQLSDEGAIRYARAIQEHANNMWAWTYGEKNRETGIIDVMQLKARNQEAFDFQLGHDFSTMRMYDLDDQDDISQEERRDKKGSDRVEKLRRGSEELQDRASKVRHKRKKDLKKIKDRRDNGKHEDKKRKGRDKKTRLKDRSA